jgi:sensor histidine kinase regulating citrate/malate metabolism
MDLDNLTYNRKDRKNKNGGGGIVYFHDHVLKYERRVKLESENTESMWFEIFPKHQKSYCM